MKIGIFSDSHYSSVKVNGNRYNSQSLRKIKEAYDLFKKEECELVVCLGDLIDTEPTQEKEISNLREIAQVIRASGMQTVCVMGNHDAFALTPETFYETLGFSHVEELSVDGRRLLFLDACYFKDGRHYAPGDSDWTDTFFPAEKELREKLSEGSQDTYIFVHQSIDPAIRRDHRIFNADSLVTTIRESGKVKTVFQGHYHPGIESEYDGIRYITLPAMCEQENAYFIRFRQQNNNKKTRHPNIFKKFFHFIEIV